MSETVIGDRDIGTADLHAARGHFGTAEASLGQMLLERRLAGRGVAQAKPGDGLRRQPTPLKIAPGLSARAGSELGLEEAAAGLHQRQQPPALVVPLRLRRRWLRQRDTGLLGQP